MLAFQKELLKYSGSVLYRKVARDYVSERKHYYQTKKGSNASRREKRRQRGAKSDKHDYLLSHRST
jgi:hypothetical protein